MAIEIWPEGDIEIGTLDLRGETYLKIILADDTGEPVEIGFRLDHFVAFADHCRMVADATIDRRAAD